MSAYSQGGRYVVRADADNWPNDETRRLLDGAELVCVEANPDGKCSHFEVQEPHRKDWLARCARKGRKRREANFLEKSLGKHIFPKDSDPGDASILDAFRKGLNG